VKFLIDNALSPVIAERLQAAGHDAKHVRDYELQAASDDEIFDLTDGSVVVIEPGRIRVRKLPLIP
jgi:predicted nuclease of predicted toxin-antitoxin system